MANVHVPFTAQQKAGAAAVSAMVAARKEALVRAQKAANATAGEVAAAQKALQPGDVDERLRNDAALELNRQRNAAKLRGQDKLAEALRVEIRALGYSVEDLAKNGVRFTFLDVDVKALEATTAKLRANPPSRFVASERITPIKG